MPKKVIKKRKKVAKTIPPLKIGVPKQAYATNLDKADRLRQMLNHFENSVDFNIVPTKSMVNNWYDRYGQSAASLLEELEYRVEELDYEDYPSNKDMAAFDLGEEVLCRQLLSYLLRARPQWFTNPTQPGTKKG